MNVSRPHRMPSSRNRPTALLGCAALVVALSTASGEASAQEAPDWPSFAAPSPAPAVVEPPVAAPAPALEPPPASTPATPTDLALPETPTRSRPIALRHNLAVDLSVTLGLAAGLVTWVALIKPNVRTPTCTICDPANGKVNGLDDFFRTSLRQPKDSPAGPISDLVAYGLAPATGIALAIIVPMADKRGSEAALDILLVMEASLTFAALQQGITEAIPRERPEVHASEGAVRESSLRRHSSFESFPAGHSGSAFAIAAAGGTIATMRGYRLAPLVWIAGGVLALTASYLRIAADRHYFTDVTVGGALGVATGIGIPLLFHRPIKDEKRAAGLRWLSGARLSTTEVPGGRIVGVGWSL